MKRLFLWIVLVSTVGFAQETATDTTKHWTRKGVFTFLANQSSFSNWQAGGQNNFAGNVGVNYDFNYKKGDWNWDNKIIVAYGLTKIKGADTQKTDDRFEFNSLLGKKLQDIGSIQPFLTLKRKWIRVWIQRLKPLKFHISFLQHISN